MYTNPQYFRDRKLPVQAVLHSDDNAVLQSGGEALRAYLAVAPDQVAAALDPATGTSGLQQVC